MESSILKETLFSFKRIVLQNSNCNVFQAPNPRDTPPMRPLESDADVSTDMMVLNYYYFFLD